MMIIGPQTKAEATEWQASFIVDALAPATDTIVLVTIRDRCDFDRVLAVRAFAGAHTAEFWARYTMAALMQDCIDPTVFDPAAELEEVTYG